MPGTYGNCFILSLYSLYPSVYACMVPLVVGSNSQLFKVETPLKVGWGVMQGYKYYCGLGQLLVAPEASMHLARDHGIECMMDGDSVDFGSSSPGARGKLSPLKSADPFMSCHETL